MNNRKINRQRLFANKAIMSGQSWRQIFSYARLEASYAQGGGAQAQAISESRPSAVAPT